MKKNESRYLVMAASFLATAIVITGVFVGISISKGLAVSGQAAYLHDSDGDGLADGDELSLNLDPQNPDTDNDLLSDGSEVIFYKTNPLVQDTDGDGILDGKEVEKGSNPLIS